MIEDDACSPSSWSTSSTRAGSRWWWPRPARRACGWRKERQPEGIILDVKLPDIDGWTVMERLRQDPATRPIPVHFVSAVDAPERGMALGAVGYLTKPATHAELAAGRARADRAARDGASQRILVVEDDARGRVARRAARGRGARGAPRAERRQRARGAARARASAA